MDDARTDGENERVAAARRAVLRMELGEPDGVDVATEIASERETDR